MEIAVVLGARMARKETRGSRESCVGAACKSDGLESGGRQRRLPRQCCVLGPWPLRCLPRGWHAVWHSKGLQAAARTVAEAVKAQLAALCKHLMRNDYLHHWAMPAMLTNSVLKSPRLHCAKRSLTECLSALAPHSKLWCTPLGESRENLHAGSGCDLVWES